jgi:hypothetical protein
MLVLEVNTKDTGAQLEALVHTELESQGRDGVQTHEATQTRWRMVNAPHLVALVRAGADFVNGALVERVDQDQLRGGQQAA